MSATKIELEELVVTRMTICHIQVCTVLPEDEVEAAVRAKVPCGTSDGWRMSTDPDLAPVQCEEFPERTHYVLAA